MIINTDKGNIKVLGDIREFKTSIDPKNLEFITTLLSSNLYSDPEQSFIREIVSNAWDSHVEAGTTDIPVIIRFKRSNDDGCWEVTIRDFGTGLSPERFQEVYCNIGSSTKRESNEFIGGFGIGKYSSLACTNTVYITSYYEGTAFLYVMVKSGNTITTNLVMKKPTEEKNGVEVTIKNISNIVPYRKALKYIVFFPNVYVDGIDNRLNNTKLKRFNNFAVASEPIDTKILLGNVLYPCNTRLLSITSGDFLKNIEFSGIVIKFNVGEISITPNRENIIYSSDTISKIEDRIKAAKAELDTMVSNKFSKDYDNLYEYYKVTSNKICYNPLDDSYYCIRGYPYYGEKGYCSVVDSSTLTFKGSTILRDCEDFLSSFFGMKLPNFKGLFYNDRFYQNKIPYNAQDRTKMGEASIIMIESPRLTAVAKSWLQDNYDKYTIITSFDKAQFTSYIEDNVMNLKFSPFKNALIDYMYDYIMSKVKVINLDANAEFLAYKEELKSNKIPVVKIKDFILYIQKNPEYREKRYFKDINCCIKYIKSLEKGVILADMKESDSWYSIAEARGFVFIRARKEIIDAFYELKPTFLVNKDWVLKEDPIIVKLHTIIESFKGVSMPTNYNGSEMLSTIPMPLKSKFKDIIDFYYRYIGNKTYVEVASKCTKIDSYIKVICEKFKSHIEIYNNLSKEVELKIDGEESLKGLLMAAVIVKSKAYRINPKIYDKVKNNKLLRVLCRK